MQMLIFVVYHFCCMQPQAMRMYEPKLVIRDSTVYAISIHDQVGTLYTCDLQKPLDSALQYDLPAGRRERSLFQPLAWDLGQDTLYAVNFTDFAQNDRMQSLKSIPLARLAPYKPGEKTTLQLLQGAYANAAIENLPLVTAIKEYKFMDNLYFDLVYNGSKLYEPICVNGEITTWMWDGSTWERGATDTLDNPAFFCCFSMLGKFYLLQRSGNLYIYTGGFRKIADTPGLVNNTLVLDKDAQKAWLLNSDVLQNGKVSLAAMLSQYGMRLPLQQ